MNDEELISTLEFVSGTDTGNHIDEINYNLYNRFNRNGLDNVAIWVQQLESMNVRWAIDRLPEPVIIQKRGEKKKIKHPYECYISNINQHQYGTKKFVSAAATGSTACLAIITALVKYETKRKEAA